MEKETKQFQAETKQLLNLMIHSIYTHREIFLRELLSNASDAIDKIKFMSLTDQAILEGNSDFGIKLSIDKTNKTIKISDNGIGMTYDDVVNNIGTIARSGSKIFAQKLKEAKEKSEEVDLIGQFGVGFYSSFMVAKNVTLITKAPNEKAIKWQSTGDGTYTIEYTNEKTTRGTDIILDLRPEDTAEGEDNSESEDFLSEYKLESLVKKYSDYIRYPIKMDMVVETPLLDKDGKEIPDAPKESKIETKTLNSMVPLWRKDKKDITKEEYNEFYKTRFHDWEEPIDVVHFKAEGTLEYTAMLYIPGRAPFDFYSKEFHKGVQLYSKNVFIMENCPDLLPDHLRFVKGLVDSADFSLNISREILQHDRQLKAIAKNLEKKIVNALKDLLKNDRKKYEAFWKEFGDAIKSGIYSDYMTREELHDLLIFKSSNSDDTTTLEEYIGRMKEKQEVIYYAAGQDKNFIEKLPQMEILREKGFEVLYFVDRVDEFTIDRIPEYKGKKFQSITRGELNLGEESEELKKKVEETAKDNKQLLDKIKEHLAGKVSDVKVTNRLKSSPVCLVSDKNGISLGMEKIMADIPNMGGMKASRILELNPDHAVFSALKANFEKDANSEIVKDYSDILYSQALLLEGFQLEDPLDFANKITKLMTK